MNFGIIGVAIWMVSITILSFWTLARTKSNRYCLDVKTKNNRRRLDEGRAYRDAIRRDIARVDSNTWTHKGDANRGISRVRRELFNLAIALGHEWHEKEEGFYKKK